MSKIEKNHEIVGKNFKSAQYDGLRTSPEILAAIREIAGEYTMLTTESGRVEIDPNCEAYKLWAAPGDREQSVISRAIELARDTDIEALYWGDNEVWISL